MLAPADARVDLSRSDFLLLSYASYIDLLADRPLGLADIHPPEWRRF